MAKIIFGYKMSPNFVCFGVTEGYKFFVYEKGTVRLKKFVIEYEGERVIESRKIIIPKSVAENVKNYLESQKNLIDGLPEDIYNHSLDGKRDVFYFLGKKISCLNISRHDIEEISEPKIYLGEFSSFRPPTEIEIMKQENAVLEIFENVYNFLKDYGLIVHSWNFYCEWKM